MSDAIIVAVIGGAFALLGAIVQGKRCCISNNSNNNDDENTAENVVENINNRPSQVLNELYEVVPEGNNTKIDKSKYITIFDDIKYKIEVEPQLELGQPDIVNVFNVEKYNYNSCNLILNLTNVTGKVYLFVKRFNDKWEFRGRESIKTIPAANGSNKLFIKSYIGVDEVTIEQIGLMVHTCQNVVSGCNVEEAKLIYN